MRIYNRGGLIAIIDTPGGQLSVASYHPHPGRYPENKALDFGQLVGGLTGPVIVCGDPSESLVGPFLLKMIRQCVGMRS